VSIDHPETPRPLPDRPGLRHLKDQAKDLLKAHIDSLEEIGQLKQAIDTNDIARVKTSMTRNPTLHSALNDPRLRFSIVVPPMTSWGGFVLEMKRAGET
jgi:hypothetical protein